MRTMNKSKSDLTRARSHGNLVEDNGIDAENGRLSELNDRLSQVDMVLKEIELTPYDKNKKLIYAHEKETSILN